jgi:hypothetical protein
VKIENIIGNKSSYISYAVYILIFLGIIFFCLPFILFRDNSIVTIHDYLDFMPAWLKMFHDNDLFFKFDVPTKGFGEISTLYYGHINFSFQNLLFYFFADFVAYVISYYCSIIFGLFSMYFFLKKFLRFSSPLFFLISICYAVLPICPVINIGINTTPFIIYVFISFLANNKLTWKTWLLLFFPFFSSFTQIGILILGFWFIGFIVTTVKNKRLNQNLIVGFIVLCLGYIVVDLKLFYVMFVVKEPLNRAVFNLHPSSFISMLKIFLVSFKNYFINGYYHAASIQRRIMLPFAFIFSLFLTIRFFGLIKEKDGRLNDRLKGIWLKADKKIKLLFVCELFVLIFSGIAALYDSGLIDGLVTKFIPIFTGFNWGRVWIFNRVLWYVIFALCLDILSSRIKSVSLDIGGKREPLIISNLFIKNCAYIIVVLQLIYIAVSPVPYNDQVKTWFNELFIKTGIAGKFFNRNFDTFISYKEFYSENLFEKIKEDIGYKDEKVVAFGYHPAVLMYNGFNCIDGYNNAYPLKYMQKFRTLIGPELEINGEAREYYDSWGGRMYLYNSELGFEPTRNKNTEPVQLNIDMDVFRNDFGGKYILSRAVISNASELGLYLVNKYDDEQGIYIIYLYTTKV